MLKVVEKDVCSPLVHPISYAIGATAETPKVIGVGGNAWVFDWKNRFVRMAVPIEDWVAQGKVVIAKLEDPAFLQWISAGQRRTCKALKEFGFSLRDADFSKSSNEELAEKFSRLSSLLLEMNVFGDYPNLADFEHNLLSNKLGEIVERKAGKGPAATDAFVTLTTATEKSPLQLYDEVFYEVLGKIQENPAAKDAFLGKGDLAKEIESFPELDRELHSLVREYDWMQYHYDGPTILDEAYFLDLLASELRQGTAARKKLEEIRNKARAIRGRQAQLERQFGLPENERYWFGVGREMMFLKGLRKDTTFQASRNSEGLMKEIARRLGLTRVQVRHLTPDEVVSCLRGAELPDVQERVRHSVWIAREGKLTILTGAEAERVAAEMVEESLGDVSEVRGTPACTGKVKGIVKVVFSAEEMGKVNPGDILVSPATNPNLVPAMKKAAAIVTDAGGLTCHAAIVSRELGIPCVVGTKAATMVFKDGDVVEVDANLGVVRKVQA